MSTAPIIGDNDVKPVIFREYIGVKGSLDNFPANIIDPHTPEFHFILGFALETYVDGKGTGTFEAKWNTDHDSFSREKVDELKKKHPNVKVVISIGARDTEYAFHPAKNAYWCDNAVNSLKEILQIYTIPNSSYNLIDGIDINYEYIHPDVSEEDFSYYIGDVIKRLKQHVGMVSIAPSHETQKHYKKLYNNYTNDINLVNYQFYIDTLNSKDEFVNLFHNLTKLHEYDSKKLLAGASTDPADAGEGRLSRDDFLEGCVDLHSTQSLRGIFIWNADDSAHNENPFSLEKKAQEILNN